MRLIAREASKFGGTSWLTYDAVFRRNQEGSSAPWNVIDASLHQVYVANQQEKVAVPCKHCQEVDHSDAECAVAAILPKPCPHQLAHYFLKGPTAPQWGRENGRHLTVGNGLSAPRGTLGHAGSPENALMPTSVQTATVPTPRWPAGTAPSQWPRPPTPRSETPGWQQDSTTSLPCSLGHC